MQGPVQLKDIEAVPRYMQGAKQRERKRRKVYSHSFYCFTAGDLRYFRAVGIDTEAKAMVIVYSAKAYICNTSNECTLIGVADRDSGHKSLKPMYLRVFDST